MNVSLGKMKKLITNENITIQINIENEIIKKDYNLINLIDKINLSNILFNEIYKTDLFEYKYSINFLLDIEEENIYINEILYILNEKKLIFNFLNKNIKIIDDIDISGNLSKCFLYYNYKNNFNLILDIKDEIIVDFYLIPEFYNNERIDKFLNKINKEIDKLIIIKEDNLNNFYIDSEFIGYYIDWDFQNNLLFQRLSEKYLFMFPYENINISLNHSISDFMIKN
jgi:hypothetical protein